MLADKPVKVENECEVLKLVLVVYTLKVPFSEAYNNVALTVSFNPLIVTAALVVERSLIVTFGAFGDS